MLIPARFTVLTTLLVGSSVTAFAQHAGHTHTAAPTPTKASTATSSTATASTATSSTATLPLVAHNPTIVAVPPSITETSAFLTVKNTGKTAIKLVGVRAGIAGHSMFMKTVKQQNMTGMLPAAGFVVPAGGTLVMKNDGDHVMLMKLKRALKVGEVLPIVLQASDGRTVTIKATVKKP